MLYPAELRTRTTLFYTKKNKIQARTPKKQTKTKKTLHKHTFFTTILTEPMKNFGSGLSKALHNRYKKHR